MSYIIIVDKTDDLPVKGLLHQVVSARDYITRPNGIPQKYSKVINLCREYSYLSTGYYCSLLAEAREDKVIPSAKTILDYTARSTRREDVTVLQEMLARVMKANPDLSLPASLPVYFGRTTEVLLAELARKAFDLYRYPLLSLQFSADKKSVIESVKPRSLKDLKPVEQEFFIESLHAYTRTRWTRPRAKTQPRFYLAVLHNPADPFRPSNDKALRKFIKVGEEMGIDVDLIEKKDYLRLAEYDALFIRETTALDNHTYRFALKAEKEGMPVIDDTVSIMRCANKVYLSEMLRENKIPSPKTVIFDRRTLEQVDRSLNYPMVLKIPDGSFSRGVFKVQDRKEFDEVTARLLKDSDVILAQEYMYTHYDWRVGVLAGQPLFVCQYFMSKNHWQIVNHTPGAKETTGDFRSMKVEDAPAEVIDMAVKAARLIGDGLYGVDLKQTDKGIFVIEVNDNPNIDAGVEDTQLKDMLYQRILEEIARRVEHAPVKQPVKERGLSARQMVARQMVERLIGRRSSEPPPRVKEPHFEEMS